MNDCCLLDIVGLTVAFKRAGEWTDVVRDVSVGIKPLEAYGLIGESGCGKSTLGSSIMGYLPKNGRISAGSILFERRNLVELGEDDLMSVRGRQIAMVYQNPFGALNPSLKVLDQLIECVDQTKYESIHEQRDACYGWLRRLHMPDPERVGRLYPHNLSGGMLQRIVIAMAMLLGARLLVLDEPTTALDTTVQAETLEILLELKRDNAVTLLVISHDLGALSQICDRIGVMYAGEIVEQGPVAQIVNAPRHPYTASLLKCIPSLHDRRTSLTSIPGFLPSPEALPSGCIYEPRCSIRADKCRSSHPKLEDMSEERRVRCFFPEFLQNTGGSPEDPADTQNYAYNTVKSALLEMRSLGLAFGDTPVLQDVSLTIGEAETVALVGESGSGKSTLALALAGLLKPDQGSIIFANEELRPSLVQRARAQKRQIQMVFQSPDHTLNPSRRVNYILGRAIALLRSDNSGPRKSAVKSLLASVSLPETVAGNAPRRLSGGQRQRVAIARAFAGEPKLVILDEPTSALDVSAQASIINLLTSLQQRTGCSYLFITHDLAVVRYLAHRVVVLYLGVVVDSGTVEELFRAPTHPYTEALVSAIPSLSDRMIDKRVRLHGENPGPRRRPQGCPFHTRCAYAFERCAEEFPPWQEHSPTHHYLCWIEPQRLETLQRERLMPKDSRTESNTAAQ